MTHTTHQAFSSEVFKYQAVRFRSNQIIYICNSIFVYPKDYVSRWRFISCERLQVYITYIKSYNNKMYPLKKKKKISKEMYERQLCSLKKKKNIILKITNISKNAQNFSNILNVLNILNSFIVVNDI